MMYHNRIHSRGFTLIESLVAISIFVVVIISALTLITQTITVSALSKERLVASYLATEGLELVRWQRDSNMLIIFYGGVLAGNVFTANGLSNCGINGTGVDGSGCHAYPVVGATTPVFVQCTPTCPLLETVVHAAYDFYTSDTAVVGPESIYRRTITIDEVIPGTEATVESTVTWDWRGATQSVTETTTLHNWVPPTP